MAHMKPITSKQPLTRVQARAERQAGRVAQWQLGALGVTRSQMRRWSENGRLIPVLPKVFALGNVAPSRAADLWAAILYAGPEAMLSHATAAYHRALINYAPALIEVSTPRRIREPEGIRVHGIRIYGRRTLERERYLGMPVSTVPQMMVDLAAVAAKENVIRRALGQLDFQQELDLVAISAAAGHGKPGSMALRAAIDTYDPAFKYLNEEAEVDFYEFCEAWGIRPLPVSNVELEPKVEVDAVWWKERIAVEIDGKGNHHSRPQVLRDNYKDIVCRRHGLTPIHYSAFQVRHQPQLVYDDLVAQLSAGA
jgi:hypothetical protein